MAKNDNSKNSSFSFSEWKKNIYEKFIKSSPERKKEFTTASFYPVNPLYTKDDLKNDFEKEIGFPGEFPFTRGPCGGPRRP